MTRSKRLNPVVKVAEHREKDAARRLGQSQQRLEQQRARLRELVGYRDEYHVKFQQTCGRGVDVKQLQEYRLFLARLNDAIAQQQNTVVQAEREVERCRTSWLSTRTRSQALDKVRERYQDVERQEADRREQADLDERSTQSANRNDPEHRD